MNEYGFETDSLINMQLRHLENYIVLIRDEIEDNEKVIELLEKLKIYMEKKDNMITQYMDDTFKALTNIKIDR